MKQTPFPLRNHYPFSWGDWSVFPRTNIGSLLLIQSRHQIKWTKEMRILLLFIESPDANTAGWWNKDQLFSLIPPFRKESYFYTIYCKLVTGSQYNRSWANCFLQHNTKPHRKWRKININLIKVKITISVYMYITKADLVSLICCSFDWPVTIWVSLI